MIVSQLAYYLGNVRNLAESDGALGNGSTNDFLFQSMARSIDDVTDGLDAVASTSDHTFWALVEAILVENSSGSPASIKASFF